VEHLNVMQFLTVIRARIPRCRCPEHGVKTVRVPWAEKDSRFTLHFEALAVEMIGACRSLTQAADLLQLDWDGVQRIVDRAVVRACCGARPRSALCRARREELWPGPALRLDRHRHQGSTSPGGVPGNDQAAGESLWRALPPEQRSKVEAAPWT